MKWNVHLVFKTKANPNFFSIESWPQDKMRSTHHNYFGAGESMGLRMRQKGSGRGIRMLESIFTVRGVPSGLKPRLFGCDDAGTSIITQVLFGQMGIWQV